MKQPLTVIAAVGTTALLLALIVVGMIGSRASAGPGVDSGTVALTDAPAVEQVILTIPDPGEGITNVATTGPGWRKYAMSGAGWRAVARASGPAGGCRETAITIAGNDGDTASGLIWR